MSCRVEFHRVSQANEVTAIIIIPFPCIKTVTCPVARSPHWHHITDEKVIKNNQISLNYIGSEAREQARTELC